MKTRKELSKERQKVSQRMEEEEKIAESFKIKLSFSHDDHIKNLESYTYHKRLAQTFKEKLVLLRRGSHRQYLAGWR